MVATGASLGADFPTWRTITVGSYESVHALRHALNSARCAVGTSAGEALDQPTFTVGRTKTEVDLVVLSVADLGFEAQSTSIAEIHVRARRLGLELCPAEVAPQLRLQYLDQPRGEFLHIAMEPIATHGGDVAFILGNGGAGLLLIGGDARPDLVVSSTVRFVFARPVLDRDAAMTDVRALSP